MNSVELYTSPFYYIVFILLETLNYIFYYTKRLVVSEEGIESKILWNISMNTYPWESIEEAYVLKGPEETEQKSVTDPYDLKKWLEGIGAGTTIKFIVVNREAFTINLQDIKNSSELNKLLIEKVRFVKY